MNRTNFTENILIKIEQELESVRKSYKMTEDIEEKKVLLKRAEELDKRRKFHEGVLERRKEVA